MTVILSLEGWNQVSYGFEKENILISKDTQTHKYILDLFPNLGPGVIVKLSLGLTSNVSPSLWPLLDDPPVIMTKSLSTLVIQWAKLYWSCKSGPILEGWVKLTNSEDDFSVDAMPPILVPNNEKN